MNTILTAPVEIEGIFAGLAANSLKLKADKNRTLFLPFSELKKVNPDMDFERLSVGELIELNVPYWLAVKEQLI